MDPLKSFFAELAKRPESTRQLAEIAGLSQKGAWLYKNGKVRFPNWASVEALKAYMESHPLDQQRKPRKSSGS